MTKAWSAYREIIIDQYKNKNMPLHEVQRIMEEKYNFKASCVLPRSYAWFPLLLLHLVCYSRQCPD